MKKKLLVSFGIILLSGSIATGVFAATKYTIFVNGNKIAADVKVINGSTYVPLRAVSEALGANVNLDSKGAINITNQNNSQNNTPTTPSQPTPTQAPTLKQAARTNPANISEVVPFTTTGISEEITGNLSVLKTIRGTEAWKLIYDANKFNSAPKAGYEYILASIKIDIISNLNSDNAVSISPMDFTLVSSNGVDYSRESVVVPDPEIRTQIYAGGSQTGWVAFLVKTDDPSPLIVYGRKYNGSAGLWFKTN
ncbi:stalk domain-containing protein [Paenibacillus odorifer]|uniref:Copper amine oxidase-like N-terminal domain-containing protein n=1 Tax=Paenibacillus odorifer TaxID=189426 RepID=A0A1R0WSK2_9BACL|nr:stalk domain-containing protein [Paenibacillus odorifer]OMD20339.1 hypothetical protein BJP51_09655 [Paenibacillus odorifer]OMD70878.1 hypothetical protein BSK48_14070 [Paenibacillus odorifer]